MAHPHPPSTPSGILSISTINASSYPPVPSSPTGARSFASTTFAAGSSLHLAPPPPPLPSHFLSRRDVDTSVASYERLSEAAKTYRDALTSVASAASVFGAALESCARCKASGESAESLMNAGGLQYLIASNMHILSQSLYRGFEVPLLHELDSYKEKIAENEDRYKKEAQERSKELRKREQQHLKLARNKKRNLQAFRVALVELTQQIDELEHLKFGYYRTALDLSQQTAVRVLDMSSLAVRAEIEIFEKVAQKGWDSSGGLDDLIARSADPFTTNSGQLDDGRELFSILPSHSILPGPHGPVQSPQFSVAGATTTTTDDSQTHTVRGESASVNGEYDEYDDDAGSIFSGRFSNAGAGRMRGAGGLPPFSPTASSAGWGRGASPEPFNLPGPATGETIREEQQEDEDARSVDTAVLLRRESVVPDHEPEPDAQPEPASQAAAADEDPPKDPEPEPVSEAEPEPERETESTHDLVIFESAEGSPAASSSPEQDPTPKAETQIAAT